MFALARSWHYRSYSYSSAPCIARNMCLLVYVPSVICSLASLWHSFRNPSHCDSQWGRAAHVMIVPPREDIPMWTRFGESLHQDEIATVALTVYKAWVCMATFMLSQNASADIVFSSVIITSAKDSLTELL